MDELIVMIRLCKIGLWQGTEGTPHESLEDFLVKNEAGNEVRGVN